VNSNEVANEFNEQVLCLVDYNNEKNLKNKFSNPRVINTDNYCLIKRGQSHDMISLGWFGMTLYTKFMLICNTRWWLILGVTIAKKVLPRTRIKAVIRDWS
jgi:hypothetical protein